MLKPMGIIPAMITPFKDDYTIHESAIRLLVDRLVTEGAHGVFALGTNGEFLSLTLAEKIAVTRIVVDEAKGRIPVYVGTGGLSTLEVIELNKQMEQVGADAVSIITPYFLPLTAEEVCKHYERIADSTALPIVLYNIPARTGIHLEPETVHDLSQRPNVVGVKDSGGNLDNIKRYIELCDPGFSVLCGSDRLIMASLLAGGAGAVAATANVLPKLVVSIFELWKAGKGQEAQEAQLQLDRLCKLNERGTLPSIFKLAMNELGLPAGPARLPVSEPSLEVIEEVRNTLLSYGEKIGEDYSFFTSKRNV